MSENAVARQIVDAAYRVHTTLGPGLLESVYEAALAYELESGDSASRASKPFPWSTRQFTSSQDFTLT
jgi:GxxExxY protein